MSDSDASLRQRAAAPTAEPAPDVAKLLATRDAAVLKRLEALRARRRAWQATFVALAVVVLLVAVFFPHLRPTLALFAAAGALLWVRATLCPMPLRGGGAPFGGLTNLGRLLAAGAAGAGRKRPAAQQ